jgi:signal peptidase I
MSDENQGGFWDTIKTVIYAVLIAVFIRSVGYEPFNIPSGSMIPTLLIGDYLFVSKFSYGYSKHSLPLSPPIISGRVFESIPDRGDVAVFKLPRDNKTDYIKRIIGLPGDRIQMRGGRLYINDKIVPRKRIEDYAERISYNRIVTIARYIETLPNGRTHMILETEGDSGPLDNTPVFTVPPRHYFAMGDNRDNSSDSRVPRRVDGVGFIPAENLVGRAEVLFFSTDGSASVWEPWRWFQAARIGRFFKAIE